MASFFNFRSHKETFIEEVRCYCKKDGELTTTVGTNVDNEFGLSGSDSLSDESGSGVLEGSFLDR